MAVKRESSGAFGGRKVPKLFHANGAMRSIEKSSVVLEIRTALSGQKINKTIGRGGKCITSKDVFVFLSGSLHIRHLMSKTYK